MVLNVTKDLGSVKLVNPGEVINRRGIRKKWTISSLVSIRFRKHIILGFGATKTVGFIEMYSKQDLNLTLLLATA